MTNLQKNQVIDAINHEIKSLGSASRVATKCGVSKATVSNMLNRNWDKISTELWYSVANRLGVKFDAWQIAPDITNTRIMTGVFNLAKQRALFLPVSYPAGSGKSGAAKHYTTAHAGNYVYYITAREWARREYLTNLMQVLGIEAPKGVVTVDKLGQMVIDFFIERADRRPLLIVDEADKLKPSALRFHIHLYNYLEDKMGLVMMGTEHLEKEIKRGVKLAKKGFDELDSRLGRKYIRLSGATLSDVKKICNANGITDAATQRSIFKEAAPVEKMMSTAEGKQAIRVVEDLRRLKRIVQREQLMRQTQPANA